MITQDDAVAEVLAKRTVSLDVAAASIPMGRNKAYRLVREGRFPVPVIPLGDHGVVVPTPELRRLLQLHDFTVGPPPAAVPLAVEMAGGEANDDLASRRTTENDRRPPATTSIRPESEKGGPDGGIHSIRSK